MKTEGKYLHSHHTWHHCLGSWPGITVDFLQHYQEWCTCSSILVLNRIFILGSFSRYRYKFLRLGILIHVPAHDVRVGNIPNHVVFNVVKLLMYLCISLLALDESLLRH